MSGVRHFVIAIAIMQLLGSPGEMATTSTIRTPGSSWSGQRAPSSDTIIFPDSKEKEDIILPPPPKIQITPCPNGQKFCDDDDNYPSNYLRKLPREFFDPYNNFFLNDSLVAEGLSTRIDGQPDEQPLCLSKEELMFPRKAQTADMETKLIVNHGKYLQGVRVEVCLNESSPCQFQESFPAGYRTVCRQKYVNRKLVVVATEGGDATQAPLSTSEFVFPSCCVCRTQAIGRKVLR